MTIPVAVQIDVAIKVAGEQPPYEPCRRCGACCRCLIIECGHADVAREPKIAEKATLLDGNEKLREDEWEWCLTFADGCSFLAAGNTCSIYATRPEVCAAFVPGGSQCRAIRREAKA